MYLGNVDIPIDNHRYSLDVETRCNAAIIASPLINIPVIVYCMKDAYEDV